MSSPGGQTLGAATDYPYYYKFQWSAALNNIDPTQGNTSAEWVAHFEDTMGGMVLTEKLIAASSDVGGSPYAGVAAYNPNTELAALTGRVDDFATIVANLGDANLTDIFVIAVGLFDGNLDTAEVDLTIAASEAASLSTHLAAVGRVNSSLWAGRANMGTQAFITVAAMENDRALRLNDESFKLRMFSQRERTDAILRMADHLMRHRLAAVEAQRALVTMQFDTARLKVSMKQDQIEYDLDMEVKDATWDLDLFAFHHQALAAISGASTIPRAQTKRERLAAAVMTSASFGIQTGMSMGSPGAGVAGGILALSAQLYGLS